MENTNYSQMFNVSPEEETIVEQPEEKKPEQPAKPAKRFGYVSSCAKLNMREAADANAEVIKVIDVGTKVKIVDNQDKDFYKVTIKLAKDEFLTGYCMKKFITEEN